RINTSFKFPSLSTFYDCNILFIMCRMKEGKCMKINVRPHDSLWYYCQLFVISLILIEKSNLQTISNQLAIGEPIQVPGYALYEYTVKKNDSLWKIAMLHNIPLDTLQLVNPSTNATALEAGQIIYLPQRINEIIISDRDNYTYEK